MWLLQGDHPGAFATLSRVHQMDPNNLSGMDVLAAIMCRDKKVKELESFSTRLLIEEKIF